MKKILAMVTALILSALVASAWANIDSASKIVWQDYTSNIFEQAKANHRPVILLGKQQACHWCEEMELNTFSNPTVIKLINNSYTPTVIDMNRNRDIFIQYKIIRLPTTIIFNTNGKVIKIASGYIKPDRMIKILKAASSR